jgi:hypothetical protein
VPNAAFDAQNIIRNITLLLDKGFNISEINDEGLNCLHLFFLSGVSPLSRGNWKSILIFLIDRGADVYATDYRGRSVSEVAYSETCWDRREYLGTYRGDLWDAVLDSCGYDIFEFRKSHPRKVVYDRNYSRQDFELLWKHSEHRCPYWDDTIWLGRDQDSGGENQNCSQERICICDGNCHLFDSCGSSEVETDGGLDGSSSQDEYNDGEDETDMDYMQCHGPSAGEDFEAVSQDEQFRTQGHSADETRQDMEEQESIGGKSSSTSSPTGGCDMDSSSLDMNISRHHSYFRYNIDSHQHDELFRSPWRDDQP